MGCGCDGLSSVRQGGWCLLTWITWIAGGAKVRLAWVVTIWLCITVLIPDGSYTWGRRLNEPHRSFVTYTPESVGLP